MKKMILLALAAVAFTATARVFTIELGNGDLKLDRKYLMYGSADLLGIECITAGDTGSVTLSVGKHMDAKQKVITYTEVYETNITHVTDWYEYNWIGYEYCATNQWCDEIESGGQGDYIWYTNSITVTQTDANHNKFNCDDVVFPRIDGVSLTETTSALSILTKLDQYNPSGSAYPDHKFTATTNTTSGLCEYGASWVVVNVDDPRLDVSPERTNIWGIRLWQTDKIEHGHDVTNVVHAGTITNVSWKAVNRTCYQSAINTNLTDGIIIHYLDNPIRLFRNDYLRSTCPIEDQTNPGIYHAIMKDEGAASIIL